MYGSVHLWRATDQTLPQSRLPLLWCRSWNCVRVGGTLEAKSNNHLPRRASQSRRYQAARNCWAAARVKSQLAEPRIDQF